MRGFISLLAVLCLSFNITACKTEKKPEPALLEGIVNFVSGDVTVLKDGKNAPAKAGDKVSAGMRIITGAKSFADIYVGINAVKMTENSDVEIKTLVRDKSNNTEKTELYLKNGKVFSRIARKLAKGDSYSVRTPTTIAGVRGTDFVVTQTNGKGNVACLKGKVRVRSALQTEAEYVDINGGQEVTVEKGKELTVVSISEENMRNLRDIIENISELKAEIRQKFENQKREIKEKVIEQKEKNREMINKQKEENKENIENQKLKDKENIENIKEGVNKEKDKTKDLLNKVKKPDLKSVKPKIK